MKEIIELRVLEEHAHLVFNESEGRRISDSIRKIELDASDERWPKICEFQRNLRSRRDMLFAGWQIRRRYSQREVCEASLFCMLVKKVFEPAGEEYGTVYDETTACRVCNAGSRQIGQLSIPAHRLPKGYDFAKTIAGEVVVSQRVVDLLSQSGARGIRFGEIYSSGKKVVGWSQLFVMPKYLDIVSTTRVGNDPCDDDWGGMYRCNEGDLLGLNLLSEVTVDSAQVYEAGSVPTLFGSAQFIGLRSGLLRPERILFANPAARQVLVRQALKGIDFEVAKITAI